MMDLTPLDVRKKKGDFRRGLRGYEAAQVDDFLDLVADRLESLVREASTVNERIARLEQQVSDYRDREKALTEALVTAQQMREDIRTQSTLEVELLRKQAEQEAEKIHADAVRRREREEQALEGLRSRQFQFLSSYQKYLEQELAELAAMVQSLQMHAGGGRSGAGAPGGAVPRSGPPSVPVSAGPSPEGAVETPSSAPSSEIAVPADSAAADVDVRDSSEPGRPEAGWSSPAVARADLADAVDPADSASMPAADPDAPLEEALARWGPEFDTDEPERAAVDETDEATADEDRDDLLLSAEDVVPGDATEPVATADGDVEDDADLAFLDFGEDEVAVDVPVETEAVEAPAAPRVIDTERVAREVDAAMVQAESTFIDLGMALGDEPAAAAEVEAPVEATVDTRDEADEAIDAAFDFGDDEAYDDEARMEGPPAPAEAALEPEPTDDEAERDEDIDFVDALLMETGMAFGDQPSSVEAEAADESEAESIDTDALDDIRLDIDDPEPAGAGVEEGSPDPDLIDLDEFGNLADEQPPAPKVDVSSLTLHPMFFEKEASKTEAEEPEKSRQDHWSSSGGG